MSYLGPSLRRRRRASRAGWRIAAALLVSLAVNVAVLRGVHVDFLEMRLQAGQARPVALAPLSREQWEANRRTLAAPPEPAAPRTPPGILVEVPALEAGERPAKPPSGRFVSDRDNVVERETQSRFRGNFQKFAPTPVEPRAGPAAARAPAPGGAAGAEGKGEARRPGAPGRKGDGGREEKVAMALDPEGLPRRERPAPPGPPGQQGQEGEGGRETPGPGPLLAPSAAFYESMRGPTNRRLDDVEYGEGTFLNTREWKFAGYFNRMREALAGQWDPFTPLRARDSTGERFLYKDWTTVLSVTLDARGSLSDVHVLRSSGLDFFDRTAVEAMQKAQPFLNPPRDLPDSQGLIRFHFGFILYADRGPRFFGAPLRP